MAFGFYKGVRIQTGQAGTAQTNFPALVPFLAGDADFASVANGGKARTDGFDIRPYADSGLTVALTFQLVSYSAATGAFEMWVLLPTAQDGVTVYMAVGDNAVSTDGSSTSVWDSNFYGVYHDPSTGTDASQGGNTLTNHNSVSSSASGQIGNAGSFASASTQYMDKTAVSQPAAITMSGWINPTTLSATYNTPLTSQDAANTIFAALHVKSTGKMACYVNTTLNSGTVLVDPGSHTVSTGTLTHIAMTYDSVSGLVVYVNSASDGTFAANGTIVSGTVITTIGRDPGTAGREWNGLIDEVHLSNIARSASWITTEYNNQVNLGNFWTKGTLVPASFTPQKMAARPGVFNA
jgi:hypothetical protein